MTELVQSAEWQEGYRGDEAARPAAAIIQARPREQGPGTEFLRHNFKRIRGERVLPPDTIGCTAKINAGWTAATLRRTGGVLAIALFSDYAPVILLYDVLSPSMECVGQLRGHVDYIHDLAFNHDGTLLLSSSADRTCRVWATGHLPCIISNSAEESTICRFVLGHEHAVYGAVYHRGFFITVGYSSKLRIWSGETGRPVACVDNVAASFVRAIRQDPTSDSKLWTLDGTGNFVTWHATEEGERLDLHVRRNVLCSGATSLQIAGPHALLSCRDEGLVYVVDICKLTPSFSGWLISQSHCLA